MGVLYGLGNNRRSLGISTVKFSNGEKCETGYYELDAELHLIPKNDVKTNTFNSFSLTSGAFLPGYACE